MTSSFVTTPDSQASQQRPRSNTMATLGSSGIDLQASIRLPTDMARTMDWAQDPYVAFPDDIMGQLQDTSSYFLDQQSPVNGTESPLSYLYASPQPIARQYGFVNLRPQTLIDSACSNIDPQLQASTLVHHSSPYGTYNARSLPNSIRNSPTSTPTHTHEPIKMSPSPARPLPLPRANMSFCQSTPAQRTSMHPQDAESEAESQKSTSDAGKNRAFLRKGRSGTVYTVCPKQLYRCLYDPKCTITKQKACDMKDHYYSVHAQFNCMQCNSCGNSYARPCTYKRHLKEDGTCPKPRTLTAEQVEQGRLRREIMGFFADMTNEKLVRKGVALMKRCNMRSDMRKRKRRVGCYRKQDSDDADEEDTKSSDQLMTDCAGAGSQFTSVNAHNQSYFPQPSSQNYSFHEPNQLFEFPAHDATLDIAPRNYPFALTSYGPFADALGLQHFH